MKCEEVITRIESARAKGEKPDLIGAGLCGLDLRDIDFSDVLLQGGPHLAGIYKRGTKPVPGEDPIKARYDSKTKFPEGFDRYEEMEKVD